MKIEHKIFDAEVKAFDDANLIVENFISTEHKDRGGDIMRVKGMKIVGKPVVLMLHGRGPMGAEPVARPLSITVDEFKGQPGILAKTQFFDDEVGRRLYAKIKGGFLPNWSIGYSVDEAKDIMEAGRFAGRDVTKWQLYEYSIVGTPMNPFAQTIKEFLDADDAGKRPEIKEQSHWFGIADEKTCTGCGACPKPGDLDVECPTCKGEMTIFTKGEDHLLVGSACPKCQPEEAARLQKEIETTAETEIEKFKREAAALGIIFEKADDMSKRMTAMEKKMADCEAMCMKCEAAMQAMADAMKKFEPLLKTLPPEPEGGKEGDEEHHDNPPEKKTPPRLVIVREEETSEAEKQAARARILAIAREVVSEAAKQEIDRMKGRVP